MPSSKWTDDIVGVPQSVISLSKKSPRVVYCNLRPGQRDQKNNEFLFDSQEFDDFLRTIDEPALVAIHYQHYRPELSTVVVRLEPIECWDSEDGLPRLDCEKPGNWNHCPNLWGTFVLAIARVKDMIPTVVVSDPDSKTFEFLVKHHGVPTNLTRFRRDLVLPILLTSFQAFDRGEFIRQRVDRRLELRTGDIFEYEAGGNLSGSAQVVSVGEAVIGDTEVCELKKLS